MKRRDFLRNAAVFVSGASISLSALEFLDPKEVLASQPNLRWAFLVNTHKCVGCGFCVKACKIANDIPGIDPEQHNAGTECAECHNPHNPSLEEM